MEHCRKCGADYSEGMIHTCPKDHNGVDQYDNYLSDKAANPDYRGDEMSLIAQEKYELEQFENSLEGRLVGFTTDELVSEVNARTERALEELRLANERLTRHLGLEKAPF